MKWSTPVPVPATYAYLAELPAFNVPKSEVLCLPCKDEEETGPIAMLEKKLHGVVLQFCSSCSPQASVQILNIASQAITSVHTLIAVFEETLHAYFSQSQHPTPPHEAAAALRAPGVGFDEFSQVLG